MVFFVYFADFSVKFVEDRYCNCNPCFSVQLLPTGVCMVVQRSLLVCLPLCKTREEQLFQEGSFIGGNIRLPRVGFFLPFQPSASNTYWAGIWPWHVSGVAVLQDLAKSL